MMNIAIVGCGFVADFYLSTLGNYPNLHLLGVTDQDRSRIKKLVDHHTVSAYDTLDELLADDRVEMVLNLTNPRSHYEVSKQCLLRGKHVYSEKPLATDFEQAKELVEIADSRGLHLSSAPCNVLSESAQTLWKLVREDTLGKVRLVYAEMDDGLIHRMRYREWKSEAGIPWPWKDEFEVGCTLEHAGYYVTWLVAFFGSAKSVTSFSTILVPDKETDEPLNLDTSDFTVATIQFHSGVVARLTTSIYAPHDHRIRIFGDEGIAYVNECWKYDSPVYVQSRSPWALRLEKWPLLAKLSGFSAKRVPLLDSKSGRSKYSGTHSMDFARGVADLADAATNGRPASLSATFSLHVNEIVLAIQDPAQMGCPRQLTTATDPMAPMPWSNSQDRIR